MPSFQYLGKGLDNRMVKGKMEAADEIQLYQSLRSLGIYLIKYKKINMHFNKSRLTARETSEFARNMGTMLSSGIPLIRCLEIMIQSSDKKWEIRLYELLYHSLQQGIGLSDGMKEQEGLFPPLLINMFKAGEASGKLDRVALLMAKYYENERGVEQKIQGALIYPIFLCCLTLIVMIIIFTAILPSFFALFANMELPASTQFLLLLSNLMIKYWYQIIAFIVMIIIISSALRELATVQLFIGKCKLSIPVIGNLLRNIYTARFARTLSLLYSSGLPLLDSIEICGGIIGNTFINSQFPQLVAKVRNGIILSEAIKEVEGFNLKLASSIFVGEETGHLDDLLQSMADAFDYDADQSLKQLTSFIEPVLIVFLAVVIGYIMIAVTVPVYEYYQSIPLY